MFGVCVCVSVCVLMRRNGSSGQGSSVTTRTVHTTSDPILLMGNNNRMKLTPLLVLLVSGIPCCYPYIRPTVLVEGKDYWEQVGRQELKAALNRERTDRVARNVILFVGDGMGVSTVTAGRIFRGQRDNHPGEEGYLNFERFPHVGLLKTYNVDKQVPDSAATATALFTGSKTNYFTVGVDASVKYNVCDYTVLQQAKLESIASWAQQAGKDTGIVTNTRITHATPAAMYANSPSRFWECDGQLPVGKGCTDIARQLVETETGRNFNVIMGGGQLQLGAITSRTPGGGCKRSDGRNLTQEWLDEKQARNTSAKFVTNSGELFGIDPSSTEYVLGLFAPGHMSWDQERPRGLDGEPSLAEMTRQAIKVMSKNKNGYVLMVEGGRIDHAHHQNLALKSLQEVVSFDDAVEAAVKEASRDTLVLVTADHSHTLTINGYPERGQPIEGATSEQDGFMYETLSYFNGPGYSTYREQQGTGTDVQSTWRDIRSTNFSDPTLPHFSAIFMNISSHGGEDVSIYAQGPMSHLIHGVHEQTYPAYVIAYAACIGPYTDNCARDLPRPDPIRPSKATLTASVNSLAIILVALAIVL